MNLRRLTQLRTRLATRTVVESAGPWAFAAAASVILLILVDAIVGIPAGWRVAGLAAAGCLGAAAVVACVRSLSRGDWTMTGVARWRAAHAGRSVNALASYFELRAQGAAPAYVANRLETAAAAEAESVDPRAEAPLAGALRLSAAVCILGLAALTSPLAGYDLTGRLVPPRFEVAPGGPNTEPVPEGAHFVDAPDSFSVVVTPPSYAGRAAEHFDGPSEIAALAGSQVDVVLVPGHPAVAATLTVGAMPDAVLQPDDRGALASSFVAREPGSIAVRPTDSRGERRVFLLPMRIIEDRAPDVRITKPAADILVEAKARPGTLDVEFEAADDLGLGPMKLSWIRSIGEGDAAEFTRGELPVQTVGRTDSGAVRGRCRLDLERLGIVPGSSLVFHVEAQDRNTVTGPSTGMSESLVFEVSVPDPPAPITLADLQPEDFQRYLVSQRMILEKTLKLHARREKTQARQYQIEATNLAREQREFKESFDQFIEIHGQHDHGPPVTFTNEKAVTEAQKEAAHAAGHEDDEEHGAEEPTAEAEEAHDAAAAARSESHTHGPGDETESANTPFRDLLVSIRAMWDAERALGVADTAEAIPHERRALEFLKKAQKATRYFSRVRVTTKPIDLKRRYAGELAEIRGRVERMAVAGLSPAERAMREQLAALVRQIEIASTIDTESPSQVHAERAEAVAVRSAEIARALLGLETGFDPALVEVAGRLTGSSGEARRLHDALVTGETGRARSALTAVTEELAGAASQLAALLDSRAAVRGPSAGRTSDGGRAEAYFRRLAERPR
jgi:hypothetical protein